MKRLKKWLQRTWVACMALCMAFIFSSCTALNLVLNVVSFFLDFYTPPITLEYTLTEEDMEEFKAMAEECKTLGVSTDEADIFKFTMSLTTLMDKFTYIDGNADVAYLLYCMNTEDEVATENYLASEKMATELRNIYVDLLKTLLESSPYKEELFAGMSEEELAIIRADREKIGELQLRNSELTREFYDLPEDENWLKKSGDIYSEIVANNQAMAIEYNYSNYYSFASEVAFSRKHTQVEIASFRSNVAKYIVPILSTVYSQYKDLYEGLSEYQKSIYAATSINYGLVDSYMGSFDWTMSTVMRSMSTVENAALFADNENALPGAFTTYVDMYEQPIVYFGKDYQDVYTYVHEQGHYVAAKCYEGMVQCYDLAELHSQGNEWLFISYLDGKIDAEVYELIKLNRMIIGLLNVVRATLVDHFEETVYKSEKPIAAKDYNKTMQTIYQQYPGVKETMDLIIGYDVFEYVQKVALLYPGYYLNYATSEIAAMNLHTTAMLEGYEVAQDAYVSLMSMDALELNLSEAVALVGLDSPFVEETFISLQQVLLPNTNN